MDYPPPPPPQPLAAPGPASQQPLPPPPPPPPPPPAPPLPPANLPPWIGSVTLETARWPGVAGTHDAPAHTIPGLEGWVTVTTTDLSAPTHQPGLLMHRLEALQHAVQALPPPEARDQRRTRPWASTTETPLKTQTIRLLPSTQQLNKTAGIARWSFNRAIAYLRQHPLCGTTQLVTTCTSPHTFGGPSQAFNTLARPPTTSHDPLLPF
ncbi:hypothetical protein V8E36_001370 [Tilletia maclaganii]